MSIHFMGVDAGGTRTRALLATADGDVVGRGLAEGANAWSSGGAAVAAVTTAIEAALAGHEPASVEGGVVAVAGGISSVPELAVELVDGWQALGIAHAPHITIDVVAAFAAATTLTRGLVLTAGTGAIAALVADDESVRRAGGRGWLVGDEGSAVWLGIEGVRAALLDLDARGRRTVLTRVVIDELGVAEAADVDIPTRITDAVYASAPASLGRLAPRVVEAARDGDDVAAALVDSAADHLVETAVAAAGAETPTVVVLGGSVLLRAQPIGERVRRALAQRWPRAAFEASASAEAGAAAMAIRRSGRQVSRSVLARLRASSAP